jgi:hypothetical protein
VEGFYINPDQNSKGLSKKNFCSGCQGPKTLRLKQIEMQQEIKAFGGIGRYQSGRF